MKSKLNIIFIYWMLKYVFSLNPCLPNGHEKFPIDTIGLRNENCSIPDSHDQVCDKYLDSPRWYIIEEGTLLNHCPVKGLCGNAFPAWMNGSFPAVEDGEIDRTACIKRNGICCKDHVTMKVKNCSGYFVYHLKPLKECPSAYCVESTLPCKALTTTTKTPLVTQVTDIDTTPIRQTNEGSKLTACTGCIVGGACAGVILLILLTLGGIWGYKKYSCTCNSRVDDSNKAEPPPSYDSVTQQDAVKVISHKPVN